MRRSGVFIVNFEHISHLVLVSLLLTLNMSLPAALLHTKIYESQQRWVINVIPFRTDTPSNMLVPICLLQFTIKQL